MFQDIIRLTVQRILNDKILLGILIICLLGFFVGGFSHKDEPPISVKGMERNQNQAGEAVLPHAHSVENNLSSHAGGFGKSASSEENRQSQEVKSNTYEKAALEPALAVDFVKWWMKAAMDYGQQSAAQSHEAASNWMAPDAYKAFCASFWTPELAQQITSGSTTGAFQPIAVQAEAINPDQTVVVGLTGTLVLQEANKQPRTNQVKIDVLVKKGGTGLRISGINNQLNSIDPAVY